MTNCQILTAISSISKQCLRKFSFTDSSIFPKLKDLSKMNIHVKCRNSQYPFSQVQRFLVPDACVSWEVLYLEYDPPEYSAPKLLNKSVWADPNIGDPEFSPKWNNLDGTINRRSFRGLYKIVDDRPQNPEGRTGLKGRGVLGRWGPNHAADPIVTRWKRDNTGKIALHRTTKLPILQFCAIQRKDNNEWAIPGGFVDPGEPVSQTLRREFAEEALNSLKHTDVDLDKMLDDFFQKGEEIYRGYVDDPRNTDNAWIETMAYNYHDETGTSVGKMRFEAGDDARNVRWTDIDKSLNLYASHKYFIKDVKDLRHAHW